MRKFCLFFISILLVGCAKTKVEAPTSLETQTPYVLSFEQTTKLNTLEPTDGILFGIYFNENYEYMVKDFEPKIVKNPNHYVYEYVLGTTFDTNKIIECIATNRTFYLKIIPNKYSTFNLADISSVANIINAFNIDCYVELFPNPSTKDYSPEIYKDYFEQSSEILKQNENNISIIYTPSKENLTEAEVFCPNFDSFDFVGYEYIGYIQNKNENIYEDFFAKFDYVYKTFQSQKPIFITTFAISNYSNRFNTYYIEESTNYINEVFDKISKDYPRVKGVNFYDINSKDTPFIQNEYNNDDYMLTSNLEILSNFNNLISNEYFLSELITTTTSQDILKYNYDALMVNDEYFVSTDIISNPFLKIANSNNYIAYDFNGKQYYKLIDLQKDIKNYFVKIDTNNNIIKLHN